MGEQGTQTSAPVVIAFGPPHAQMWGMHHRPAAGTPSRAMGVVLCPPLGWEMIASHRSHRALADRLCARGFHVLRFDYPGTGDSSGDELDPGRVRAWLEGVGHAIEELKRRSQVNEVALVGVRLGAWLAALYASQEQLPSPAALILWAPFLTGRSYLRELRAYQALNDQRNVGLITSEGDTAGFVLSPETSQAIHEVDLLKLQGVRARDVLVLARDENSNEQKLTEALAKAGINSELARIPGLLPMLQEPRKSVVPSDVFAHMTAWLENVSPPNGLNPVCEPAEPSSTMRFAQFREEAQFFGSDDSLFGIADLPDVLDPRRPAVLWLNTANDHRIGPNRSYVPLARSLASLGYASFRFDPRGVGDGATVDLGAHHAYSDARQVDVTEAIDFVQRRYGIDTFVLVGLCSGAYMAFHFGVKDRRVVGEVLINPQTFEWREGDSFDITTRTFRSTRAYKQKLLEPSTWKRAFQGDIRVGGIALALLQRGLRRGLALASTFLPGIDAGPLDVKRAVRAKLRRGIKILFLLAENDSGLDFVELHLGHRGRAFRSADGFAMEIVPGVDHTFSQRWAKDQLGALVTRHLTRNFR
jgi:alpha-beta hydrolase superfamily lysophospholipase